MTLIFFILFAYAVGHSPITYTDKDVCFEECDTAMAILLKNNGEIIHTNFNKEKSEYFQNYLKQIYPGIISLRNQ